MAFYSILFLRYTVIQQCTLIYNAMQSYTGCTVPYRATPWYITPCCAIPLCMRPYLTIYTNTWRYSMHVYVIYCMDFIYLDIGVISP